MSEHCHDENDVKLMREMRKLAPEDFNAWLGLNNTVGRENGAIPQKVQGADRFSRRMYGAMSVLH